MTFENAFNNLNPPPIAIFCSMKCNDPGRLSYHHLRLIPCADCVRPFVLNASPSTSTSIDAGLLCINNGKYRCEASMSETE